MNNPVDLKSCIQELQSLNKIFTAPCLYLEFRRDFVLVDALKHADKSKFDPKNKLKVHVHVQSCYVVCYNINR